MDPKLRQTIIDNLGIASLPVAQQDQMIERIGKLIFQGTLMRALQDMTEQDQKELETLLKTPNEAALMGFLKAKVPNLEEIVKEEAERFKQEAQKAMEGQ
jgi:hypothetical protein